MAHDDLIDPDEVSVGREDDQAMLHGGRRGPASDEVVEIVVARALLLSTDEPQGLGDQSEDGLVLAGYDRLDVSPIGLDTDVLNGTSMRLIVDLMPTDRSILGFANRWYPEAFASARLRELTPGVGIRVITPLYFVATKLEALASRGAGASRGRDGQGPPNRERSRVESNVRDGPCVA